MLCRSKVELEAHVHHVGGAMSVAQLVAGSGRARDRDRIELVDQGASCRLEPRAHDPLRSRAGAGEEPQAVARALGEVQHCPALRTVDSLKGRRAGRAISGRVRLNRQLAACALQLEHGAAAEAGIPAVVSAKRSAAIVDDHHLDAGRDPRERLRRVRPRSAQELAVEHLVDRRPTRWRLLSRQLGEYGGVPAGLRVENGVGVLVGHDSHVPHLADIVRSELLHRVVEPPPEVVALAAALPHPAAPFGGCDGDVGVARHVAPIVHKVELQLDRRLPHLDPVPPLRIRLCQAADPHREVGLLRVGDARYYRGVPRLVEVDRHAHVRIVVKMAAVNKGVREALPGHILEKLGVVEPWAAD